ncbi:hypothetical protein AMJ47_03415 [Parcubacteria bacterium DG_72]|nr:MAG: hypothetical protein AMJ47_03415 [Parcubacteria bacterium DG_72]
MIKKCFLLLIILTVFFNIAVLPVLAQEEKPLDVEYPDIPDSPAITPDTTAVGLPEYVEYIFYFLIWGSGILALLALIYGGFKYITAIGNPDKLRDAKDRIISAILGLLIVVGSYVILWQINPQFLRFSLPPLRPMINTISPGVYVCKTMPQYNGLAPLEVWILEQVYLTERLPDTTGNIDAATVLNTLISSGFNLSVISDPNNMTIRKQIKNRIDKLLNYINKRCYEVKTAGAIKPDFNDKIESIWFIPESIYSISTAGILALANANPYGAAVFDDDDFTGIGNIFFHYMFTVVRYPRVVFPTVKVSSIKPFKRYTRNLMIWKVRLYVEKNYNAGFKNPDPYQEISSVAPFGPYYADVSPSGTQFIPKPILETKAGITIPPKSIRIDGEALVILYKDALKSDGATSPTYTVVPTILRKVGSRWEKIERDEIEAGDIIQEGYYFQIFFENDNNLEDDYNIVWWDRCLGYEATEEELAECNIWIGSTGGMTGGGWIRARDCCAKADADAMIVLSNIKAL